MAADADRLAKDADRLDAMVSQSKHLLMTGPSCRGALSGSRTAGSVG